MLNGLVTRVRALFAPKVEVSEKKVVVKKAKVKTHTPPHTTPVAERKGTGKRYTDEVRNNVIKMLLDGKTQKEVSQATGVTLSGVGYIASAYKKNVGPLPHSREKQGTWLTRQKVREVYTYRGKGYTWDEIQGRTGVDKDIVGKILRDKAYTRYTKDMTDYR